MFNKFRQQQFTTYNAARTNFINNPHKLIELEKYITEEVERLLKENIDSIVKEYNEASYLYPFWSTLFFYNPSIIYFYN